MRDIERKRRKEDREKLGSMSIWDKTAAQVKGGKLRQVAAIGNDDPTIAALSKAGSNASDKNRVARSVSAVQSSSKGTRGSSRVTSELGGSTSAVAAERERARDLASLEETNKLMGELSMAKDRRREKENLSKLIEQKREMFLVQMSLDTKREEMRMLEERAQKREEDLKKSEQMLEEDAMRFDAFLKENDMKAVEAIKRAELETKHKLDKVQEIRKLNTQMMAVKSEMAKYDEQLDECRRCKAFMDSLTPAEWFEQRRRAKLAKRAAARGKALTASSSVGQVSMPIMEEEEKPDGTLTGAASTPRLLAECSSEDDDSDGEMYFKEPQQLLDIFAALEESNLFLIQNTQETEETLEEVKGKFADTTVRMEQETETLRQQIEHLNAAIAREESKASALEESVAKTTGIEGQEKSLAELQSKVTEVYVQTGFDNDANLSALQMLRNIEARLEELFSVLDTLPPDYVETAEKQKEKERRQRKREDKKEVTRALQEERIQRALKRSQAPVHKKQGKTLMFRSMPPQKKKKEAEAKNKKTEEEDDLREFFT